MNRQKSRLMRVASGVYAAFIFLFLYAPIARDISEILKKVFKRSVLWYDKRVLEILGGVCSICFHGRAAP